MIAIFVFLRLNLSSLKSSFPETMIKLNEFHPDLKNSQYYTTFINCITKFERHSPILIKLPYFKSNNLNGARLCIKLSLLVIYQFKHTLANLLDSTYTSLNCPCDVGIFLKKILKNLSYLVTPFQRYPSFDRACFSLCDHAFASIHLLNIRIFIFCIDIFSRYS